MRLDRVYQPVEKPIRARMQSGFINGLPCI